MTLGLMEYFREKGTITATNIIVDYQGLPNPDMRLLKRSFDSIAWNPYWDGGWNRGLAEARWEHYLKTDLP
jgi:hypothetical protein